LPSPYHQPIYFLAFTTTRRPLLPVYMTSRGPGTLPCLLVTSGCTTKFVEIIYLLYCYLLHCLNVIVDVFCCYCYLSIYLSTCSCISNYQLLCLPKISIISSILLFPKHFLASAVKLNDTNYFLWAQSFRLFIGLQKKLKHLTQNPSETGTTAYDHCLANNCSVMT